MKITGRTYLFATVGLAVCAGFGVWRLGVALFCADSYSFVFDHSLSASARAAIQNTVAQSGAISLDAIANLVAKTCPAAQAISVERCADKSLHVGVQVAEPVYCLAQDLVLLANNVVVAKECFEPAAVAPLPVIQFEAAMGAQELSTAGKAWLLSLDKSILEAFTITWRDDYEIYVKERNGRTTLVCSVDTIVDEKMRHACSCIVQQKMAQGTAPKKGYIADVRFEKQIILCSQKGGAVHG